MKLYFSPASPYARKVMVSAHEKGLAERIELLPSAANPVNRDQTIVRSNPSGKVPTMLLDTGEMLYDSRVICAYVDSLVSDPQLLPASGPERFAAMTLEALGDAILDAALLARYEVMMRPEELRWVDWSRGQMEKIDSGLESLEGDWLQRLSGPVTIGTITAGCALGYLDFRFADKDWRSGRPKLAAWFEAFSLRPSMRATFPAATK